MIAIVVRQRGLSLVELMVALAIGAFLVLGVVTVFISNKDSSEMEKSLARLQENGRFAVDMLAEDLYQSQFLGCNTGDVFLTNMIDDPTAATFTNSLQGVRAYEKLDTGSWESTPTLTEAITSGSDPIETVARNGSDVLSVRLGQQIQGALLSARVLPTSSGVNLHSNPDCAISEGDRVVLTGCSLTAHMFEVSNNLGCTAATAGDPVALEFAGSANATTAFNTSYGDSQLISEIDGSADDDDGADILVFEDVIWFVEDTGRRRNGLAVMALYRDVNGQRQEMIEGVENMQIKFGQRVPSSDNLRYVDPSDAQLNSGFNYDGVSTVRIALLLQSFDLVLSENDDRAYRLLDVDIPASGSTAAHSGGPVLRRVFTTTVNLRNAPEV